VAFSLSEPIVRAIVDRLVSDLPAAVASINAELADGIDLDLPPNDRILPYVPSLGTLRTWPTIGIEDVKLDLEDDIGSSVVVAARQAVIAFDRDRSLEHLGWKLRRWERAITTAVMRDRTLGAGAYLVNHMGNVPGRTLGVSEPKNVEANVGWRAWCSSSAARTQ
jgi:hypothetical protein